MKNNYESSNKARQYLSNLISKILLSIILVLCLSIYIKYNDSNRNTLKQYLFNDTLKFTKINKLYKNYFGNIIPVVKDESIMVFNNDNIINNSYSDYLNGVKINIKKSSPITAIEGGIIVFIGNKDKYDNTIIIQGNDGIDYWYGNITNTNNNIYDYIEKDALIGEAKEDYIYLVLEEDNKFLNYEEYLSQTKN